MQDYWKSKTINCSAAACFRALTQHLNSWWSARTEGCSDAEGGEFTVYFGKTFKTMKVMELAVDRAVAWRCMDSFLDLDGLRDKSEWNGTTIAWAIEPSEGGSRLSVTHVGLNASIGCYDACEQGWDHFFMNSLVPYLECGSGRPFPAASQDA